MAARKKIVSRRKFVYYTLNKPQPIFEQYQSDQKEKERIKDEKK